MSFASFFAQLLNGLAGASALFLVAAGLTLIFGVTRVVNFAHGSLYMLGAYIAYSLVSTLPRGPLGFWGAVVVAALAVALIGAAIEALLLKRIYAAPELLQLAATFGIVLIVRDAALFIWGAEDLLGPRAPGLNGAVGIFGRVIPTYDLFLLAVGPVVLLGLWFLLERTRFGTLTRAATENRALASALGVNERALFTLVFAVGSFLAGLAGALQLPREPANLGMDLAIIAEAFVVTVVGGLGSIPGAFVAALLIGLTKALCIALGTVELGGSRSRVSQAHAGGRIRRHGHRARREALRADGRSPLGAADDAAGRIPHARRSARTQGRSWRARGAGARGASAVHGR